MKYARAAIASIILSISSCYAVRMCPAREVYDRDELVGFRVKRGDEVYQFLRYPGCVVVERGFDEGFGVDWEPFARKEYRGLVKAVFERIEEEGEQEVDLGRLLR